MQATFSAFGGLGRTARVGLAGLVAYVSALAMLLDMAEAGPGDHLGHETVSTTMGPTGVSYGLNNKVSWINRIGDIWQGRDDRPWHKILYSVNPAHSWKFLAEGDIDGVKHFVTFDDTIDNVVIINASSSAIWGSWTYSDLSASNIYGLDISGNEIMVYNYSRAAPKRIGRFSLAGIKIDDIFLPFPDIGGGKGIVKKEGGILMNAIDNDGFYDIQWASGTSPSDWTFYTYSTRPVGKDCTDITYNSNTDVIYVGTDDPRDGNLDWIISYQGPMPPTPTPTASPSPTCGPSLPPERYITASGDYDGDGRADIAVFRPAQALWSVKGLTRSYFGGSKDLPASGDYDGDGTSDAAIFRPSQGLWSVQDLTWISIGQPGDLAAPGDYDGDGSCDIGIFRENGGMWSIRSFTRFYFGGPGDWAIPGDYGNDGTAEAALYRVGSGQWMIQGFTRFYFGGSSDWPVPGDYFGSSSKIFAIFRPCSGQWALKDLTRIYFGNCFDYPRPGDFNGDGEDDFGIFRDSSGMWSVRNLTRVYFGATGDIPVTR